MPELVKRPRYKSGDRVRAKFGNRPVGRVIDAQGAFYPDGYVIYTVQVPMDPEPLLMIFREEEIENVEEESPLSDSRGTDPS